MQNKGQMTELFRGHGRDYLRKNNRILSSRNKGDKNRTVTESDNHKLARFLRKALFIVLATALITIGRSWLDSLSHLLAEFVRLVQQSALW